MAEELAGGERLYLGCGRNRLPGHVHVDIVALPGVDVAWDLNCCPWPWQSNGALAIVAEDVVEHLTINLIEFCNEAWRIMAPGGELFIRTPHHSSENSWIDPTHRWHLDERSFHYLDPDTHFGRTYCQYTDRKWRITSLSTRRNGTIHAILMPRK
jgi:hypothetical protein